MISKKYVVGALGILTSLSIGATVQADDTTGVVEYTSGGIVFDPDKGGSDPNTQLPTNLDFGAHEIQTENAETWVATTDGTGLPGDGSTLQRGAVAVSDNRGQANSSWAIKVRQATQFTAGDSTLDGAVLTVDTGTLTNNLSLPPTGASDIANGELDFAAINNEYAFLTANAGEGIGETSMPLEQFTLSIPANTEKQSATYQTTLVWTISSAPTTP